MRGSSATAACSILRSGAFRNLKMILRNLSMIIQLLFFLGISAKDSDSAKASKRGPLDCETYDFQCCWVIRSWEKMNGEGEIPITSCCTLEEVLCDESGMVKEIDWTAKGLEGNIPDDLAHLTHLTKL
jgi:hypothetical protein